MGRLKPGVTIAKAQSLFDVISSQQAQEHPASDKGFSVRVLPEKLARPIPYANNAFILISALFLGLSAIVLLLACANVANLLMARASVRMREMAIRVALGGSRARLIRQMLTETMLLAGLSGLVGILLGWWISRMISSIHFPNLPLHVDTNLDWAVFTYALGIVVFAGIFVGLSSAIKGTASDANAVLHQRNGKDAGRHKVRSDLMVMQVAGSLALLIIAGLFTRSLQNAERMNLGFDSDHVLNVALDPQINNYNEGETREFYQELERRVKVIPGVQSAGLASSVPITSFPSRQRIYLEGQASSPDQQLPSILFNRVDSDYFKTMRIPLLLGREFSDADNQTAPQVAIVNQTMASRFWPGQSPIGKRFSVRDALGPFLQVVGVAYDSKYQTIAEEPQPITTFRSLRTTRHCRYCRFASR
jgi:predicted permease